MQSWCPWCTSKELKNWQNDYRVWRHFHLGQTQRTQRVQPGRVSHLMAWVSVGFRSININKKQTMQSVTFDLTSAWDKTTTSLAFRRQNICSASSWAGPAHFQAWVELRTEAECGEAGRSLRRTLGASLTEAGGQWPPRSWWGRSQTRRWSFPHTSSRRSGWWGWWCRPPWSPAHPRSLAQSRRVSDSTAGPTPLTLHPNTGRHLELFNYYFTPSCLWWELTFLCSSYFMLMMFK